MRTRDAGISDYSVSPFSPVLLCAIVFAGLVRIVEIVFLTSSTRPVFYDIWLGERVGPLGMGDLIFGCGVLFLVVAILGMVNRIRTLSAWMTLGFCLLLFVYTVGLRFLPAGLLCGWFGGGLH